MVRIGAMDYEPSLAVKPHTLDQRLIETLNTAQLYDVKAKLSLMEEAIEAMKKNIILSYEKDPNHKKWL